MIHENESPLAGQTVKMKSKTGLDGEEILIEDWWDRVAGKSWMDCTGNHVCINYALRSTMSRAPIDNQVLYGKIGAIGYLVHLNELDIPEEVLKP